MSQSKPQKKTFDVMQTFDNVVAPLKAVAPTANLVLHDTISEVMVRRFMKNQLPWVDIALAHVLSVPFRGGLSYGGEQGKPMYNQTESITEASWTGASGALSVLLGQYILKTGKSGLHAPQLNLKNISAVIVAQIVSRNLQNYTKDWFPELVGDQKAVMDVILNRQKETGVFKTKKVTA